MTKRPTPRLNQSEACSCQLNTRSESGKLLNAWLVEMGVPPDVAVDDDAIQLLHAKCLAGGLNPHCAVPEEKARHRFGFASLREDYLNQVQRDFLSRSEEQHP
jgi:hypothetical protein